MIPNSRIPFIYVDFDNSKAILPGGKQSYSVLLVGQKADSSSGPLLMPIQVRSEKEVADSFGQGSPIHQMAKGYFGNNSPSKTYAVCIKDQTQLPDLIKAISERQFHLIVNPLTDPESLKLWDQDLSSRFSASRQCEAHLISAVGGDEAALTGFHLQHSKHMTVLALPKNETQDAVSAAALASVIAESAEDDPARPFHTLPISGISFQEGFERGTRSRLLDLGYSTVFLDGNGVPRIERLITTYRNPVSESDESYLSLNTLLTLSYLRFSFANYFAAKYPRHKLADDTAVVRPGSAILTPKVAQCEAIALFRQWEEDGLVENFEEFKSDLIVERNKKDRGRLDFFMSPRLVSQLNVIGAKVSFLI